MGLRDGAGGLPLDRGGRRGEVAHPGDGQQGAAQVPSITVITIIANVIITIIIIIITIIIIIIIVTVCVGASVSIGAV